MLIAMEYRFLSAQQTFRTPLSPSKSLWENDLRQLSSPQLDRLRAINSQLRILRRPDLAKPIFRISELRHQRIHLPISIYHLRPQSPLHSQLKRHHFWLQHWFQLHYHCQLFHSHRQLLFGLCCAGATPKPAVPELRSDQCSQRRLLCLRVSWQCLCVHL